VSITRSYAVDDDDKRGDRRCYRIVGDGSKGGRNDDSNNSMSDDYLTVMMMMMRRRTMRIMRMTMDMVMMIRITVITYCNNLQYSSTFILGLGKIITFNRRFLLKYSWIYIHQ